MITEKEFTLQWRKLFLDAPKDGDVCEKASVLIDDLPETSPLRFSYGQELAELRVLRSNDGKPAAKAGRRRSKA